MTKITRFLPDACQTAFVLPFGLALLNIGVAVKPVQALTFQETTQGVLEFTDNGNIIGTGTFSYSAEPFEGIFNFGHYLGEDPDFFQVIVYSPGEAPEDFVSYGSVYIDASQNLHLANVNINFNLGYSFSGANEDESYYFFRPPATETAPFGNNLALVSLGDPRSPELQLYDSWNFGDTQGTFLNIDSNSFYFYDIDAQVFLGGSWTARAVIPEPFTVLGTATALGFGAFFKRKLAKK